MKKVDYERIGKIYGLTNNRIYNESVDMLFNNNASKEDIIVSMTEIVCLIESALLYNPNIYLKLNEKEVEKLRNQAKAFHSSNSDLTYQSLMKNALKFGEKTLGELAVIDDKSKVKVNISERGKKIIAGVAAAAILTTGGIIIGKNLPKKDNSLDEEPTINDEQNTQKSDTDYISKGNGGIVQNDTYTNVEVVDVLGIAEKLQANWASIGCEYSIDDVKKMVEFGHGLDTDLTLDEFDAVIVDVINKASIPAVNNAIVGTKVSDTVSLVLSDLIPADMNGQEKAKKMEEYLNSLITDTSNIELSGNLALLDEVKTNITGTDDMDSIALLVWARLCEVGVNPIVGTLGPDYTIDVNGASYKQTIVNNPDIYENIVNEIKGSFTK